MVHHARGTTAERMQGRTCCRRSRYCCRLLGARRLAGCRVLSSARFAAHVLLIVYRRLRAPIGSQAQEDGSIGPQRMVHIRQYGLRCCDGKRIRSAGRTAEARIRTQRRTQEAHFAPRVPKIKKGALRPPLCIQLLNAITAPGRTPRASRSCFPASRTECSSRRFWRRPRTAARCRRLWLCRARCCAHRASGRTRCAATC